jgi:hypothetical protein
MHRAWLRNKLVVPTFWGPHQLRLVHVGFWISARVEIARQAWRATVLQGYRWRAEVAERDPC